MKVIDFLFTTLTYVMGACAFVGIAIGFINVALGNVILF